MSEHWIATYDAMARYYAARNGTPNSGILPLTYGGTGSDLSYRVPPLTTWQCAYCGGKRSGAKYSGCGAARP